MGSNCMASASIGCLFCCQGCNAEKLRNAFTFLPPMSSYTVEELPHRGPGEELTLGGGRLVYLVDGLRNFSGYQQAAEHADVRFLGTARGERIAVVWVRRSRSSSATSPAPAAEKRPPLVLLHCHGNATDIGMMMGPYYELAKILGIEVVGVEYSGYGAASGKPSSGNTYADLEAAYDLVTSLGIPPKRIVAYGQSVGSGPVSCLAEKRPLGGIVLHSPLLSGIKVVDPHADSCCAPSCVWHCFDFYPNDRRMRNLTCPVFIMHGQRDDIIPFYHGYRLHKACPKASRWPAYFPTRAGHNDLVETDMRMYFGEVSGFLNDLKRIAMGDKVDPNNDRPRQVEMGPSRVLPNRVAEAKTSSSEEEAPTADVGDFIGVIAEPKVGPEDGRYQQFRQGHVGVPGGLASPHEPRPASQEDEEEFQDAQPEPLQQHAVAS